jgi:hypothetical protein
MPHHICKLIGVGPLPCFPSPSNTKSNIRKYSLVWALTLIHWFLILCYLFNVSDWPFHHRFEDSIRLSTEMGNIHPLIVICWNGWVAVVVVLWAINRSLSLVIGFLQLIASGLIQMKDSSWTIVGEMEKSGQPHCQRTSSWQLAGWQSPQSSENH